MFQECTIEEHRSVMWFLWTKGHNVKDIRNEMFLVFGGKCLLCKAVDKFSQGHSKLADDA
jgi:hypothetical protein